MDKNQQTKQKVTGEGNALRAPQTDRYWERGYGEPSTEEKLLKATSALLKNNALQNLLDAAVAWRRAVLAPHRFNLNAAEVDLAIAVDVWSQTRRGEKGGSK